MNWAMGQVHASTEATREEVREWNSALKGVEVRVVELGETVRKRTGSLSQGLSRLEASVHNDIRVFRDEVDRRFKESNDRMDQRFQAVDERIRESEAGTNARFDAVDRCFSSIDDQFAKVDERFTKVDEQFAEINGKFEKVDERFDRMDSKLDEVLAAVRAGIGRK